MLMEKKITHCYMDAFKVIFVKIKIKIQVQSIENL
jgi:hypothetical protein